MRQNSSYIIFTLLLVFLGSAAVLLPDASAAKTGTTTATANILPQPFPDNLELELDDTNNQLKVSWTAASSDERLVMFELPGPDISEIEAYGLFTHFEHDLTQPFLVKVFFDGSTQKKELRYTPAPPSYPENLTLVRSGSSLGVTWTIDQTETRDVFVRVVETGLTSEGISEGYALIPLFDLDSSGSIDVYYEGSAGSALRLSYDPQANYASFTPPGTPDPAVESVTLPATPYPSDIAVSYDHTYHAIVAEWTPSEIEGLQVKIEPQGGTAVIVSDSDGQIIMRSIADAVSRNIIVSYVGATSTHTVHYESPFAIPYNLSIAQNETYPILLDISGQTHEAEKRTITIESRVDNAWEAVTLPADQDERPHHFTYSFPIGDGGERQEFRVLYAGSEYSVQLEHTAPLTYPPGLNVHIVPEANQFILGWTNPVGETRDIIILYGDNRLVGTSSFPGSTTINYDASAPTYLRVFYDGIDQSRGTWVVFDVLGRERSVPPAVAAPPLPAIAVVVAPVPDTAGASEEPPKKKSGGDSHKWKTKPSFGKSLATYKQIVECGYSMDGMCRDVMDYHVDYKRQIIHTNSTHDFTLKVYAQNGGVKWFKIGFGVPEIGVSVNDAEALIHVITSRNYTSNAGYNIDDVIVTDPNNIIDFDGTNANVTLTQCMDASADSRCVELSLPGVKFREQMYHEPFVIHAMDQQRRSTTHYMNDGIQVLGESLNPAPTSTAGIDKKSSQDEAIPIQLTRIDKLNDIWEDQNGHTWTKNDYSTWIQLTFEDFHRFQDGHMSVMTRTHSGYVDILSDEQDRATLVWDGSQIENSQAISYSHDYTSIDRDTPRLEKMAEQLSMEESKAQKVIESMISRNTGYDIQYAENRSIPELLSYYLAQKAQPEIDDTATAKITYDYNLIRVSGMISKLVPGQTVSVEIHYEDGITNREIHLHNDGSFETSMISQGAIKYAEVKYGDRLLEKIG